jgi:Na+/proline symporter
MVYEWYWPEVFFIITFVPFVVVASIVLTLFFALRTKARLPRLLTKIFLRTFVICLGVALIFYIFFYNYYLDNRTGIFNPYTKNCTDAGYKGARGDGCFY